MAVTTANQVDNPHLSPHHLDTALCESSHPMHTDNPRATVRAEELEALQASPCASPDETDSPYAVDTWFWVRNAYLLCVIGFYVAKLLLFTEATVANFVIHPDDKVDLIRYIQLRAVVVVLFTSFYLWSYLRNWKFDKVALIFAVISATSFVMDYFNAYMYLHESAVPLVSWLFVLRLLALACLTLNAWNAERAPLMPRTLWR